MDTKEHEFRRREKTLLTPDEEILHKAEVFSIVGAAMAVLNELGHGLDEKPYENALVVELGLRRIAFQQQPSFQINYKGHHVGLYIPDLVVFGLVVVDAKGDRAYQRPRTWTDAQLFENHEPARGRHLEFRETQTRMGTNCPLTARSPTKSEPRMNTNLSSWQRAMVIGSIRVNLCLFVVFHSEFVLSRAHRPLLWVL